MRLSLLMVLAAYHLWGQPIKSADDVLVKVGPQIVTSSEFEFLYKKNKRSNSPPVSVADLQEYLDLYINFKLKVAEAFSRGMDTTRNFRAEFGGYKSEVLKSFRPKRNDTDFLVEEAYERLKEEIRASHILLSLDPSASPNDTLKAWQQLLQIRSRILAGEDFAQLARAYSSDPGAADNGGDLGYFSALEMVYPFENAAYKTPVGSLSIPIRSGFGYHLIKVTDRRQAEGQVEVSHILIKGNDDKSLKKIYDVAEKLKNGIPWQELCKQHSEDTQTKERAGKLPPFRKGGFDPAAAGIEKAAFALQHPGDISNPVLTSYGWHIIRLEKLIKLPDFNSYRIELQKKVLQDERTYLSAVKLLEEQKKYFGFQPNPQVFERVFSLADSSLLQGRWEFYGDPDLRSATLFSLDGESSSVWSFVEFLGKVQQPVPVTALGQIDPRQLMSQMLDGFVSYKASNAEERKLERENQSYRMLLKEYREGILLFNIMEEEVWKKASQDTIGQKEFFSRNAAKYQAGERVFARILGLQDPTFAAVMIKRYQSGDSISKADLRKFRSISTFRNFEKGESRIIDQVPFQQGLHQTETDKAVWLVEIKRLVSPGSKSFEEALPSVISDFQDELEKQWLQKLKKKYRVSVNQKVKKKTFAKIMSSVKDPN